MKSSYAERDTVGTIYTEAQKSDMQGVTCGDVNSDMLSGLVDDINDCISANDFGGRPFYITVVEERDLQMKNAIKRRMFKTLYRPYPEDNTMVFYVVPRESKVCYCWDIPHHSEMPNILCNELLYDQEYIKRIKEWLNEDLSNFGFMKVAMNSSTAEGYEPELVNKYRQAYMQFCEKNGADEKTLESIKRYGSFWLPNPNFVDQPMNQKPTVALII